MRFFVDNNLSPQLANGMRAFGEDVIHITEIFPDDTHDTEYLSRVGSEGWFLVTRDNRIRYRPAERTARKEHQVGGVLHGRKKPQSVRTDSATRPQLAANEGTRSQDPGTVRVSRPAFRDQVPTPAVELRWKAAGTAVTTDAFGPPSQPWAIRVSLQRKRMAIGFL